MIQFFTSASTSGLLHNAYKMSIYSLLTSQTLPFPRKFQLKHVKYYGIADALYGVARRVVSMPCDHTSVLKI